MPQGDDKGPVQDRLGASAFYERWFPAVYSYFRRRTSDDETAQDLTSETFERIVKALPRFKPGEDPERSTRVWVYRIAGNVYKNTLRRWSREAARDEAWAEGWSSISDDRQGVDHGLLLGKAVQTLDPLDRDILGLRFWEGLTAREIADVVDLTQREVYTALERCMRLLRRELEAEPELASEDGSGG